MRFGSNNAVVAPTAPVDSSASVDYAQPEAVAQIDGCFEAVPTLDDPKPMVESASSPDAVIAPVNVQSETAADADGATEAVLASVDPKPMAEEDTIAKTSPPDASVVSIAVEQAQPIVAAERNGSIEAVSDVDVSANVSTVAKQDNMVTPGAGEFKTDTHARDTLPSVGREDNKRKMSPAIGELGQAADADDHRDKRVTGAAEGALGTRVTEQDKTIDDAKVADGEEQGPACQTPN